MHSNPATFSCVSLSLLPLVAGSEDWCHDKEKQEMVRTEECPHGCCTNAECGSSGECLAGLIIGIIVASAVCALCVCGVMLMLYYCNRRNHNQTTVLATHHQAVQPAPMYPQYPQYPQPAYGIPIQYGPDPTCPPAMYPPVVQGQPIPDPQRALEEPNAVAVAAPPAPCQPAGYP